MKHYYFEDAIEHLMGEENLTRGQAIDSIRAYFAEFTHDELMELLIRGQIHSVEDKRTRFYYVR